MNKAVVVISGGLDSSTLLHRIKADYPGYELHGISFDYGQRHRKELQFAERQCEYAAAHHEVVDMRFIHNLFAESGSSLVTDNEVPEGHYAERNMKATVVPNRNMIMMSIAAGYAVSIGARVLATGVHAGDHFIYPDCRPEFFSLLDRAIYVGNEGFIRTNFELRTPYIHKTKADIALDALHLEVPIEDTWSCYKGGELHCGRCGTCVERLEAIHEAGNKLQAELNLSARGDFVDPTQYLDREFWREALKRETVTR